MSKISIKTDFVDGEKLFSQQLNNNFLVIQAGINANEENLQEVIDDAIIELDAELEAITANRGWDWNGGDRVTFYKGDTAAITARAITNGQLLYNTDTGETALDDDGERIVTGSGNVIAIDDDEPTNPATKLWIDPTKIVNYPASYVVDSMSGTDTNKAPSVNAVKNYIHNKSATFTCSSTGSLSLTTTYQAFPLDTQTNSVEGLTIRNDGGIEIGDNISYIKVSASSAASGVVSVVNRLAIFKNDSSVARTQLTPYNYFSFGIPSKVVPVQSGDVIYLKANQDTSSNHTNLAYTNDITYLTIEVLN